jgi:hypothetical protein
MNSDPVIRYYPATDTMAIELRPWPEGRMDHQILPRILPADRVSIAGATRRMASRGCGRSSTHRRTPST